LPQTMKKDVNEPRVNKFVKSFFTEEMFNEIKRLKENGRIYRSVEIDPGVVNIPWYFKPETCDLMTEFINDTIFSTNLTNYNYETFLDLIFQVLKEEEKKSPDLLTDILNDAKISFRNSEIDIVYNLSDSLLKSMLTNVIGLN